MPAPSDIVEEFRGAKLGDKRLTERLLHMAVRIVARPGESFPKIFATDAELEATYRFYENEKVTYAEIAAPHARATRERCRGRTVIVAHDTTALLFSGEREGAGPMTNGGQGFLGHFALCIDVATDETLGVAHTDFYTRTPRKRGRARSSSARYHDPNKESLRWPQGVLATRETLAASTDIIHVMDSEADNYVLISTILDVGDAFVIRVKHDRDLGDGEFDKLFDAMAAAPAKLKCHVPLSPRKRGATPAERRAHPPRESRIAELSYSSGSANIRRPKAAVDEPAQLSVNFVRVWEEKPPPGCEPVEWRLFTSLAVDSPEAAGAIAHTYTRRWRIEEFFKALKTGCNVEKRQLEGIHGLMNATALFTPIAWRLMHMRSMERAAPNDDAATICTPEELKVLKKLQPVRKELKLSAKPTVKEVVWAIAKLGGHLPRNGSPGWQTLAKGFEELRQYVAYEAALRSEKM